MKERGIIFRPELAQAVHLGTKTQTRREVKPQPHAGVRPIAIAHPRAPDAVFEVPAMDISCRGIDNIIAFFTQSRAGFSSARHVINNVVVEGDGDTAKSSAYLQVLRTDEGAIGIVSVGRYLDTLERTADAHRRVESGTKRGTVVVTP